eukprot:1199389-Pleurochrysis_carterae.AAC.1
MPGAAPAHPRAAPQRGVQRHAPAVNAAALRPAPRSPRAFTDRNATSGSTSGGQTTTSGTPASTAKTIG